MGRFILVRLLQTVIAMVGISVLIFVLVRASGDPTMLMRTATSTEEDITNIKEQLGLDKSAPVQYWLFVKSLAQGDLGKSLTKRRPVTTMIGEALPKSLKLGVLSFVASMIGALLLGVLAARKRDGLLDNGVKFLAVLGQGMPPFWVGIMLTYVFSVYFRLLPAGGTGGPSYFVLPVFTLSFYILPGMMRLVRSCMLDVLDTEYIKLARIKGLSENVIIWKHALRNAIITPLTTAGVLFAGLIAGEVIIETVFNWPGIGRLLVEGLVARDFPIVQGITLMVGGLVLVVNLLVDVLYAYVDPQIRYQRT
jgi:ABC-type dipeptide/oligopeptide/nickel transport system permease component